MKKIISAIIVGIVALLLLPGAVTKASTSLDEILKYEIVVNLQEDATLELNYHIDWQVLDDTTEGPLSWVRVGIPNKHYTSMVGTSENIISMSYSSSGGSYVEIYFDRDYHKGEIVSFDFTICQDNMYEVNKFEDGFTQYTFTPGWFDDIYVDDMIIRWNSDMVEEFSPSCIVEDGYLVWEQSLFKGEKFTAKVTYPNDAAAFNLSKTFEEPEEDTFENVMAGIIGIVVVIFWVVFIVSFVASFVKKIYCIKSGFTYGYDKKVTRTKVTYFESCPGCGAARKDGERVCSYCGRSFVKSEETITEDQLKDAEKDAMRFKKAGEYHYSSDPNVFLCVHVARVARPAPPRGSSGYHSSCAHSCACACACACAGGGRAGCSTKDFYNTDLKLKHLSACIKKSDKV